MSFSEDIFSLINTYSTTQEINWIASKTDDHLLGFQTSFVSTPRFVRKITIHPSEIINGVSFNNWTLDRLARVYLLSKFDSTDKNNYTKTLNTLFETAENNEAVALISALPFLQYPDYWLLRATDAVRSNIGLIFDAIAFQNPYPMLYFSELAWNQLVLKCIFNDKSIHLIQGLEKRANQELANSISNLAHERWSAGRIIPSQAWRLVSGYMNETLFGDICTLFDSPHANDTIAAALVCTETDFIPAKEALKKHTEIDIKSLTWKKLEV
jgi:hypothetical protein